MSDTLTPETVIFVSKLHATIEADVSAKEDLLGITPRMILRSGRINQQAQQNEYHTQVQVCERNGSLTRKVQT